MLHLLIFFHQAQELLLIHLFVSYILSIPEESVGRYGGRSIPGINLSFDMDSFEWNSILFRCLLQLRDILSIEGALACVIEDIALFVYPTPSCTLFKEGLLGFFTKWQIPELNAIISFVAD